MLKILNRNRKNLEKKPRVRFVDLELEEGLYIAIVRQDNDTVEQMLTTDTTLALIDYVCSLADETFVLAIFFVQYT
jgi:hypothetical protein